MKIIRERKTMQTMDNLNYNSKFIRSFNSSIDSTDSVSNDTIFHYTSADAFLSIIKSGKVRFTDIRFLNDKSESLFFVKKLIEFIEKRKKDYPRFYKVIKFLLKGENWEDIKRLNITKIKYNEDTIVPFKPSRFFVFCASKDPDALNMWNYYVKNGLYQGYNIGFNTKKLIKTFDTDSARTIDSFIVYYGNVLYDEELQFSEIESLAGKIEKVNCDDNVNFIEYVLYLRAYIELQGLFYKSPKFEDEKEYRILICIENECIPHSENEAKKYNGRNNQKMVEEYYSKGGLIIPSLSVVLPKDSISRVSISPITEFEIAKTSVEEMLACYGYKCENKSVGVYKSEIPIRF